MDSSAKPGRVDDHDAKKIRGKDEAVTLDKLTMKQSRVLVRKYEPKR